MLSKDHYFSIWEMANEKNLSEDEKKLARSAFNYAWSVYQKNHHITDSNIQSHFTNVTTGEKVRLIAVFYDEKEKTDKILCSSLKTGILYALTTEVFDLRFKEDPVENLSCLNCGYKLSGCRCSS